MVDHPKLETNDQLLSRYDAELDLAERTRESYIGIITRIASHLGGKSLLYIDLNDVDGWVAGKEWSPSYHCVIWSTVKSFVRWAQRKEMVNSRRTSPVVSHKCKRVDPDPKDPIPLRLMWEVIEAASTPRARIICALTFGTGVRRGALSALEWRDFDLVEHRLTIRAEIAKGKKRRTIGLAPWVESELLRFKDSLLIPPSGADYLFPSNRRPGEHLVDEVIYNDFKATTRRAGVRDDLCHNHAGRHSFGVSLLPKVDLFRIMRTMGHTTLAVTAKYLNIADADREQAVRNGLPDPSEIS